MSSEFPSQPEPLSASNGRDASRPEDQAIDRAIEAIVYDVHPALVRKRRAAMAYPYASPATFGPVPPTGYPQTTSFLPSGALPSGAMPTGAAIGPAGDNPFSVRPQDIYRPPVATLFHFDLSEAKADYVVPQRFGLAAILGMTTALAILFGCMRWLDAEPGWYLFYGFQSVAICIVQMFHGKSPRRASAIAGAIMGPLFVLGSAWISQWENEGGLVLCFMVMMVPCGAFLGYLNGTCAAGIFLVMDKLEKYVKGNPDSEHEPAGPLSSPAMPAS
jgi:hypothetical protein